MSAAYDKAGLQSLPVWSLIDERDRIARQSQSTGEAIRAMQGVRDQMQDRLVAIMRELQRRDVAGTDTHDGGTK